MTKKARNIRQGCAKVSGSVRKECTRVAGEKESCFNFMALICRDYIYRDLYASTVRQIIDQANRLYFPTRQTLDGLIFSPGQFRQCRSRAGCSRRS